MRKSRYLGSFQASFTVFPLFRIRFEMSSPLFRGLIYLFSKKHSLPHRPPCFYSISLSFFSSTPTERKSLEPRIETLDYLVKEHNFSLASATKVSSSIHHLKNPEKSGSILSFLKENGFSQSHIELLLRRDPSILSSKLDITIKPKIKLLRGLGFTPPELADLLSRDPWIFSCSVDNRIGPSITVLKNVLGSNEEVRRLLKVSSWFLKQDLEKKMLPNIEYLKSMGIRYSQIVANVFHFPRFFLIKPESIKVYVSRVDEMGFDRKSKMFITAIRVMSSMTVENWHSKLKLFLSLGFSENDILAVFRRVPLVFAVSERKIKEVTKLLLSAGKCDISDVVNHPEVLVCSVERRLKPRLQVIDVLEKKNLIKERPRLTTIFKGSNHQFFRRFVSPYSDVLLEELNLDYWSSAPGKLNLIGVKLGGK